MGTYSSIPVTSAISPGFREDVNEIVRSIVDKVLYVDGYSSFKDYEGIANYIFECDAEHVVTVPLLISYPPNNDFINYPQIAN